MVFHVLNRGVGRRTVFEKEADYEAFERVLDETLRIRRLRICAYCLMPNHWHFVVWPERDGELPAFMHQLTNTHVKRWKEHHREIGLGHLYQGRYKSFPVETDEHFYQVVRYVERNALRANLALRAELWPWSSLALTFRPTPVRGRVHAWPLPRPGDWVESVDHCETEAELTAIRRCVNHGCPLGSPGWVAATARQLGLESTLRPRGHPRHGV